MTTAESTTETPPKAKKSVALSGVTAGNTALCTVGRTGNDLAYRGYDILDIAATCEFEEIAYLLVHGKLPTVAELAAYKAKLRSLRGLPEPVKEILERIPAAAHPMDVMRTGVSALWAPCCRRRTTTASPARATSPTACWRRWDRCCSTGITGATTGAGSTSRPTTTRSAGISSTCCTARSRARCGCARCTRRSSCTRSTSSTRRRSPAA